MSLLTLPKLVGKEGTLHQDGIVNIHAQSSANRTSSFNFGPLTARYSLLKGAWFGGIKYVEYIKSPHSVRVVQIDDLGMTFGADVRAKLSDSAKHYFLVQEARTFVTSLMDQGVTEDQIRQVLRGEAALLPPEKTDLI